MFDCVQDGAATASDRKSPGWQLLARSCSLFRAILALFLCVSALAFGTGNGVSMQLLRRKISGLEVQVLPSSLSSSKLSDCTLSAHHSESSFQAITQGNLSLVVNPRAEAPCCGEGEGNRRTNESDHLCLSINMAGMMDKKDFECRNSQGCLRYKKFFEDLLTVFTLQITTLACSGFSSVMWFMGCLDWVRKWRSRGAEVSPSFFSTLCFGWWFVACLVKIICQSTELGFVYQNSLIQIAQEIKGAGCYEWSGDDGYGEVVSNLRTSGITLIGELVVSLLALPVGMYALYEVFVTKEGRPGPLLLEGVLLVIDNGIAGVGFSFLQSASRTVIVSANTAACLRMNAPITGLDTVIGCITTLPINQSSFDYKSKYLERCGRKSPHAYANLVIGGVSATNMQDSSKTQPLRKGVANLVSLDIEMVSVELVQDITVTVPARRAQEPSGVFVALVLDTTTPSETTRVANQLELAAYSDSLLVSLEAAGLGVSSVKLTDIGVKNPGQRQCSPGQYAREGGSSCILCMDGHYCLGGEFFLSKCANADSPAGSSSRAACICTTGFGGGGGMCMDCSRKACASGNYTAGCGGLSSGTCQVCSPCSAGFFREGCLRNQEGVCKDCPVNTFALDSAFRTGCKSCDSVCPAGQYAVGCGGATQGTCVACPTSCPLGQYLAGECATAWLVVCGFSESVSDWGVLAWCDRVRRNQRRHVQGLHIVLSWRVHGRVRRASCWGVQVVWVCVPCGTVRHGVRWRHAGNVRGVQHMPAGTVSGRCAQ